MRQLDNRVIIRYGDFIDYGWFYKGADLNDVSINQMLNSYYDVDTFIEKYNNLLTVQENINKFYDFMRAYIYDNGSKNMSKYSTIFFYNQVVNGKTDAIKIMDALTKIKQNDSTFKIVIDDEDGGYYDSDNNLIHFSYSEMNENHYTTFYHEVGHCLFDKIMNEKMPDNIATIFDNAQRSFTNKIDFSKNLSDILSSFKDNYNNQAEAIELDKIKKDGFSSVDDFKQKMKDYLKNNQEMIQEIKKQIIERQKETIKYNPSLLETINKYSIEFLVDSIYDNRVSTIVDDLCRTDDAISLVSGMIDHLFFGNNTDLNGNPLPQWYGHGYDYFHKYNEKTKKYEIEKYTKNGTFDGDYLMAFHEMVADYVNCQFSPNQDSIKLIRFILGQDLINELDKIYQEFLNYTK